MDFINVPFGWLMTQLYNLTANYGLAIIIFGIVVKVVLLPITAKSKKSTMKMSRIQPKVKALQQKYANDQQKQAQAMQALYKEEGVSMLGGCLWGFVPLLILIPVYSVVRNPVEYMMGFDEHQASVIVSTMQQLTIDGHLAIEGVDTATLFGVNNYYTQMATAQYLPYGLASAEWQTTLDGVLAEYNKIMLESGEAVTVTFEAGAFDAFRTEGVAFNFLGIDLGREPAIFSGFEFTWKYLGLALMPILSAASQVLSMFISNRMNNSVITNENGIYDKEAAANSQANKSSKTMMWVMPLMSLWIGFSMPAAMSLYWLIQGVVGTLMDIGLTRHYRKIYDAEDAIKLQQALERQREEEEKERIRAERRAQNPDGITANTSKKKLQQAKRAEEEAAKAAAAKEYAMKKGIEQEAEAAEKPAVPGSRPNSRGRAYDPNRYNTPSANEPSTEE